MKWLVATVALTACSQDEGRTSGAAAEAGRSHPSIVQIVHRGPKDPKWRCATYQTELGCLDTEHWVVRLGSHEYEVRDYKTSLLNGLQETRGASVDRQVDGKSAGWTVLIDVDAKAPTGLVWRIADVCHESGAENVETGAEDVVIGSGSTPPAGLHELRVTIDYDGNNWVVLRAVGSKSVQSGAALSEVIRAAIESGTAGDGVAPVVVIEATDTVPWAVLLETKACCRLPGVAAVRTTYVTR